MIKEIKFKIEAGSENELNKISELIKVYTANLELTRAVKVIDFDVLEDEKYVPDFWFGSKALNK